MLLVTTIHRYTCISIFSSLSPWQTQGIISGNTSQWNSTDFYRPYLRITHLNLCSKEFSVWKALLKKKKRKWQGKHKLDVFWHLFWGPYCPNRKNNYATELLQNLHFMEALTGWNREHWTQYLSTKSRASAMRQNKPCVHKGRFFFLLL